jgi:lysophosphatidylcholine acyltransferase/lyso-PAF acetyltransferase
MFPKCCRLLLFSVGFHTIHVNGKKASRSAAPVLVMNHLSPWETFAMYSLEDVTFVTAATKFNLPVLRNIFYTAQCIRVNRNDEDSGIGVEKEIRRRARNSDWNRIGVFPEGTCGNGSTVMSFRVDAFTPALPIQPVIVKYIFNEKSGVDPSWSGFELDFVSLTCRLMCQPRNVMLITYLDPVVPTRDDQLNPKHYAQRVRDIMARALGVPKSKHSVEDMMVQLEAIRLHLKPEDVVLGMESVQSLRFTVDDVKCALNQFKRMDYDHNRILTYDDFSRAMSIPDSDMLSEVWFIFTQGKVYLTVRDYIYSAIRVSKEMSQIRSITAIFRMLDKDGDDVISFQEWFDALKCLSPNITPPQAIRLFRRLDLDHEGNLDLINFGASLRKNPALMVCFLVFLAKFYSDTPDGQYALERLQDAKLKCRWDPPKS